MNTNVNTSTSVGELVAQKPSRARVFEKMGIDYCCGGKKPLAEACTEKGLDARTVAVMLEAAESPSTEPLADAKSMSLTTLADHIQATHHAYLRRELPRVDALVRKVVNAHARNHPEVVEVQRIFLEFCGEIASHMVKEEQILFPAIRSLDASGSPSMGGCGSIANPIRQMEAEHEVAGDALASFRALTGDYTAPPDVCNTYRAMLDALEDLEKDMHQHVHKENNILFPRALERESAVCTRV